MVSRFIRFSPYALLGWRQLVRWSFSSCISERSYLGLLESPASTGTPRRWWQSWFAIVPGLLLCLPVGLVGRVVAFGLMLGGIALLGTVTATLASWLVETVAAEKEQAEDLHATVQRLEAKVELLETRPRPDSTARQIAVPPAMVAAIRAARV